MEDNSLPNVSIQSTNVSIQSTLGDNCFICKVFFDRNLKKSRRRILRERDDLVSPFMLLLQFASRTGTWFALNDMLFNYGPLSETATQQLQQMFACRKCFEKVIKLERDVINFEKEISLVLDESCDALLDLDIIKGDVERVRHLQNQQKLVKQSLKKVRKCKKKKIKVLPKKKKKVVIQSQPQQPIQKTKQILVLAKAQEGDQQQLLLLQVPANDNESDDMTHSQTTAYNTNLDHQYHNDENQAVFLSSNAIPVTTCVTVTSEDQVLEVQIEQEDNDQDCDPELEQEQDIEQDMEQESDDKALLELEDTRIAEDEHEEYICNNNDDKIEDETSEAVNAISGEGMSWNVTNDGVIVVNQSNYKRKVMSIEKDIEDGEEVMEFNYDDTDVEPLAKKKSSKKSKENYTKRTYSPRSSSPLPPAGESKVVVQLLYGSKQWKRTMEGDIKSIIRDMALRRPEPAGRKIAASDKLCPAVIKNYAKRLVTECKEAARTIRVSDHQDVTQLDMKSFTSEVFQKCPKTANLIKSLIPIEPRDTLDEHGATAVIMGVILYMHSMQSNTLQHILSYVLRRAGCNREGFKTLHSLGLTLSYTSILKVMNDIDQKPDIVEKSSLDTIEKSIDSVVVRTKTESNIDKSKKKCAQVINQEPQEGDPVLLQFTLPYYQQTTYTSGRTTSVTYSTNPYPNTTQTTYSSTAQYEPSDSSNVYNQ